MTAEQRAKICKRMLWIIPGMILAIIGDYCMGIEPKDSTAVSFMISSGWLTIADWRIALSNIGGLVGTAFYTIAALSFIEYLKYKLSQCSDKWGRRILKLYIAGLIWGFMIFIYFHLACGTLIHNYNVIYEAAQGDTARAVAAWNRSYAVQAVPYWDRLHGRMDRARFERRAAAEKDLGTGGSAVDRRDRISSGMDSSAALQRPFVGL